MTDYKYDPYTEHKHFAEEIALIPDPAIAQWTETAVGRASHMFWKIPSSFTAKYHPEDEFREGGMALHTQRAFTALLVFMNGLDKFTDKEKSQMMAATLIHDIGRNNNVGTSHPAAPRIVYAEKFGDRSPFMKMGDPIFRLVETHMGKFTPHFMKPPENEMEWLVHLADYIVSIRGVYYPTWAELTDNDKNSLDPREPREVQMAGNTLISEDQGPPLHNTNKPL